MCMCVWVAVTHKHIFVDVCFVLFCFYLLFSLPSSLFDLSTNIYTTSNTNIKIPLEQPPPPPFRSENCTPDPRPPPADLRPGAFPCEEGLAPPAFLHKNPHSFPILRPRANSYVSSSALLDSFVKMLVKYYEW